MSLPEWDWEAWKLGDYAPTPITLSVIRDAADEEFPSTLNLFVSKDGTITFKGTLARFTYGKDAA